MQFLDHRNPNFYRFNRSLHELDQLFHLETVLMHDE